MHHALRHIARMLTVAAALSLAVWAAPLFAQEPSTPVPKRPPKKTRSSVPVPDSAPQCSAYAKPSPPLRTRLHAQGAEIAITSCDYNDEIRSSGNRLIEIRTSSGDLLQQLVVNTELHNDDFEVSPLDATGDDYIDLFVPTVRAGMGPFTNGELYAFDPVTGKFARDPGFPGTSHPAATSIKGCVVTELRNPGGSYSATLWCYEKATNRWRASRRCSSPLEPGCPAMLMQ